MRFLLMYRPDRMENVPFSPEQMAELGKLCEEKMKAGVVLASEGLHPSAKGARVRLARGKIAVTDGPFTEAKELVAGVMVIQVKSKAEAVELARQYIQKAGDGETEIRQVFEPSDFFPEGFSPPT